MADYRDTRMGFVHNAQTAQKQAQTGRISFGPVDDREKELLMIDNANLRVEVERLVACQRVGFFAGQFRLERLRFFIAGLAVIVLLVSIYFWPIYHTVQSAFETNRQAQDRVGITVSQMITCMTPRIDESCTSVRRLIASLIFPEAFQQQANVAIVPSLPVVQSVAISIERIKFLEINTMLPTHTDNKTVIIGSACWLAECAPEDLHGRTLFMENDHTFFWTEYRNGQAIRHYVFVRFPAKNVIVDYFGSVTGITPEYDISAVPGHYYIVNFILFYEDGIHKIYVEHRPTA